MDKNITKILAISLKYVKNGEEYRDFWPLKYGIFCTDIEGASWGLEGEKLEKNSICENQPWWHNNYIMPNWVNRWSTPNKADSCCGIAPSAMIAERRTMKMTNLSRACHCWKHELTAPSQPNFTLLGHTMSVDHLQVSIGNLLKIPAGFVPVAPDQIIPMGQGGSRWWFQNFTGTCRYLLQFHLKWSLPWYSMNRTSEHPGQTAWDIINIQKSWSSVVCTRFRGIQ